MTCQENSFSDHRDAGVASASRVLREWEILPIANSKKSPLLFHQFNLIYLSIPIFYMQYKYIARKVMNL